MWTYSVTDRDSSSILATYKIIPNYFSNSFVCKTNDSKLQFWCKTLDVDFPCLSPPPFPPLPRNNIGGSFGNRGIWARRDKLVEKQPKCEIIN